MDKIIKFLSFDSLKGIRTKLTLIADAILYGVSILFPEFVSPETWEKLQPIFATVAAFFAVEHFEPKGK